LEKLFNCGSKEVVIRTRAVLTLAVVTVSLTAVGAGSAIVGGGLDGGAHPATGMLLIPGDQGLVPECSGVLVAPRVFVTAGHCTEAALAAGGAAVAFGDDVADAKTIAGQPATDPLYPGPSSDPHDLGVVLLAKTAPVAPASLPTLGAADGLASSGVVPVSVGYGYSQAGKGGFVYDGLRHAAAIAVDSQTATLLRLGGSSKAQLCFGDSGGPQYLPGGSTVVSVTSAGTPTCEGNATATRLDTVAALAFLSQFVG
jgi:secreted trypsin-like serine protease